MKHWIEAARLRTLPLSVSGIIVGSMYAQANPTNEILTPSEVFNWKIFAFALLTTLGLQVLSNFANDYGDGVKGTDNEDRVGPKTCYSKRCNHSAGNEKSFGDYFSAYIIFGHILDLLSFWRE